MGMETVGKLHVISETKQVSERFSKREFVVELADNPKYPQMVQFQLTGDRCAMLDEFRVGDSVLIEFSLRGREWKSPQGETKYFNSLDVWKIEPARNAANARGTQRGNQRSSQGVGGGGGYNRNDGDAPASATRDYEPRPSDLGQGSDMEDLPF